MHSSILQAVLLSASLVHAQAQVGAQPFVESFPVRIITLTNISISRINSSSPTTFSATPLFQVVTQTSSVGPDQSMTSPASGTSLFHTVSSYVTSSANPTTRPAMTSMSAITTPGKSFAGCPRVPLAAAVVLGMLVGLVTVV